MSRRFALWLLLGIVILGVGLRVYHLESRSLWFDESFSWRLSEFSVSEIIVRTASDTLPPLYYILLKGWTYVFGASVLGLRSLSVFAAALTMLGTYLFASETLRPSSSSSPNRPAGLLAALLFALSAWQIPFAWETRMYALAGTVSMFSSWVLLLAVRRSLTNRLPSRAVLHWVIYALLAATLVYLHTFGFLVLAAHVVFIVGYLIVRTRARPGEIIREPLLRHALIAGILITLLYLPWLPILLQQTRQVQAGFWVAPFEFWSVPKTLSQFFLPTHQEVSETGTAALILLLPTLATLLGAVWLVLGKRQAKDGAWLIVLGAFVPIILTVAISLVGQSLYVDRFLLFAHGFFIVGLAGLIMRLRPLLLRRAGIVLSVILASLALFHYWQELDVSNRPGLAGAMEAMASQIQTGEPLLTTTPFMYLPARFYVQEEFNSLGFPKLLRTHDTIVFFEGGAVIERSEIIHPQNLITLPVSSFWLIDTTGFYNPETVDIPGWQQVTRQAYQEMFPFQAEVIVSRWQRH